MVPPYHESPHLFLNVSQDEFEDDGDYKISGSESSLDNDDILATAENPADAAEMGNVEIDVDECDSDSDVTARLGLEAVALARLSRARA